MNAIVEISLYPLDKKYIEHVDDFIEVLHTYKEFEVNTNQTSTHVKGDLESIFKMLSKECKNVFKKSHKSVFVFKVISLLD